jgi:hypothetical protein
LLSFEPLWPSGRTGAANIASSTNETPVFPHQVDHIVSRKHGGLSTLENLALACVICNRYKGSDLASLDSQTGELSRLFNPRQNRCRIISVCATQSLIRFRRLAE